VPPAKAPPVKLESSAAKTQVPVVQSSEKVN